MSATHHTRNAEYEWKELWTATIGLLNFFATKLDSLYTTGGVETLIRETVAFLDLSLIESSSFLPTPASLHEFIYELVRSSPTLEKQTQILSCSLYPCPTKNPPKTEKRRYEQPPNNNPLLRRKTHHLQREVGEPGYEDYSEGG
ncbi:hypothetical protein VNI00_002026 [Paramarasmius palmivorus]|uniref:Armadillo-like helical domain-containing protein n=1 Tax=Paramarasmius palmivorus TaxID=297713 RepID=A0AAW0E6X6_9AGAR